MQFDGFVFGGGFDVVFAAVALRQHGNFAVPCRHIAVYFQTLDIVIVATDPQDQPGNRCGGVVGTADNQGAVRLHPRPYAVGFGILRQGIPRAAARFDLHFMGFIGFRCIDTDFGQTQRLDDFFDNLV